MTPSHASPPPPHPSTEARAAAAPPRPAHLPRAGAAATLFVALLGLALGSFPARNADVWAHLAAGRALARGEFGRAGPTWLYDVLSYGLYQLAGGAGLVAVKAALVAALAVVLLRLSRRAGGWLGPCACTVLALLALGRPPLAPVTVSYLLLALAAAWAWRAAPAGAAWPGWRPVALFVVWANVDRWAVPGLGVVALIRVGRWLDERNGGGRGLLRELGAVAVLAAASAASPATWTGPLLPPELAWGAERPALSSPFAPAALSAVGSNPAALAYYALVLGAAPFLLAAPRWRWARFLPWAALAGLSAGQVRAVPFFAVVAGPVLAWGVQDLFARRARPVFGRGARAAGAALAAALAAAFLVAAWPGWLQRPPYEPRRWMAEPPAGLEPAAAAVRRGHAEGAWPAGGRTLHLARDTADAFAWFCPEDDGVVGARAAEATGADGPLAEAGVARVVIRAADPEPSRSALARLLAEPERWPLFHLEGGVAVFARGGPFRGKATDLDRLAFRPIESEQAPPAPAPPRPWWAAFWGPGAPPEGDRYQAAVLLLNAEVLAGAAPPRHLAEWQADQLAALVGAAAGWAGPAAADAGLRATWLHPPVPARGEALPPLTRFTFDSQRLFMLARDDAPPGLLYAAVRAARRAVAAAPDDATAYLLLGQCYLRLLTATRERAWAVRLPWLAQLRQSQASAALNRAVALNPRLARAHLELGGLYQRLGYNDLTLEHLRAYREAGGDGVTDAALADLTAAVERQRTELAPEVARARVADRARAALRRGLAGEARATLLESDVSAFGPEGTQLELDLLLRTGRPEDVRNWAAGEVKESLGAISYHWLRTQALAALGEYAAADAELTELAGERGPDPTRTSALFAALAGRALLGERPAGRGWPAAVSRVEARSQFQAALREEVAGMAARADAAVLRGLLALEAGEVGGAREALEAALEYARVGGVDFSGRPVAADALRWLR